MKWYNYDIRDLSNAEYSKWYSLMSQEKQQRVDRFRLEDDKKRTVAGEMLARKAISEWCNVSAESIKFDKNEYGKPYAVGLAVEFNISHSSDYVVCVVDDKPVGIDIEKIRPVDLYVAKHICTEEELIYLFGHIPCYNEFCHTTDEIVLVRFFELWTKKEACAKCMGQGMSKNEFESDSICYISDLEGYIICVTQMSEN